MWRDASARLDLAFALSGPGSLIKRGPGTLGVAVAGNTQFTGTVRVDAGTLLPAAANPLSGRGVTLMNGTTLDLRADAATNFASPVAVGDGAAATIRLDRATAAGATNVAHTIGALDVPAGAALTLASNNGRRLAVAGMTNAGTVDLGAARLTVTGALAAPATGTFGFGRDDAAGMMRLYSRRFIAPDTRGLWVANGQSDTSRATFVPRSDDAHIGVVVSYGGQPSAGTLLHLDGAWRGGMAAGANTVTFAGAAVVTFGPNFRANNLTAVRTMLARNDVRSSASGPNRALGYARAADVLTPAQAGGPLSFLGLTDVAPDDVLVRFTVRGDATLHGAVNFDDLLRLAQNYGADVSMVPGSRRWNGDFNNDARVNFDDLLVLAQNYDRTLPGAASVPGATGGFKADVSVAFAAVPEPGGLPAVGPAACAATRRRRRAV